MKKTGIISAFFITGLTMAIFTPFFAYADTLLASYSLSNNDDHSSLTSTIPMRGVVFKTPNDGVSHKLTRVVMNLGGVPGGPPSGTGNAELWDMGAGSYGTDGRPAGYTALATSTPDINLANWTTTDDRNLYFEGDQQYLMAPNTYYTLVFDCRTGGNCGGINIGGDGFAPSYDGNSDYYYTNNWFGFNGFPYVFEVYGEVPASEHIDSISLISPANGSTSTSSISQLIATFTASSTLYNLYSFAINYGQAEIQGELPFQTNDCYTQLAINDLSGTTTCLLYYPIATNGIWYVEPIIRYNGSAAATSSSSFIINNSTLPEPDPSFINQNGELIFSTSTMASSTLSCDPNSGFIGQAICGLFLNASTTGYLNDFANLGNSLGSRIPFGILPVIYSAITKLEISTTTSAVVLFSNISDLYENLFMYLDIIFSMVIYIRFGMNIIDRVKHIHL